MDFPNKGRIIDHFKTRIIANHSRQINRDEPIKTRSQRVKGAFKKAEGVKNEVTHQVITVKNHQLSKSIANYRALEK